MDVREAEHDGGAPLDGDEGAEVAARPVDLAQVLRIHHRRCHGRCWSRDRRAEWAGACARLGRAAAKRRRCQDNWPRIAGANTPRACATLPGEVGQLRLQP
jgi:hypothetical protein